MVAFVYLGGGDSAPSSHVAKIPPEFVIMNPIAIVVARLVCGVALLAFHVDRVAAPQ